MSATSSDIGNKLLEPACYLAMMGLTGVTHFLPNVIPLHVNITVFSLAIIIIGSQRSLKELIVEMKKYLTSGRKNEESAIETLS